MMDLDEIQAMISDCIKRESKITEWEHGFIQSISEQKKPLTEKQMQRLEIIWERIT